MGGFNPSEFYDDYTPPLATDIDVIGGHPIARACLLAHLSNQEWMEPPEVRSHIKTLCGDEAVGYPLHPRVVKRACLQLGKVGLLHLENATDNSTVPRTMINYEAIARGLPLVGTIESWRSASAGDPFAEAILHTDPRSPFSLSAQLQLFRILIGSEQPVYVREAREKLGLSEGAMERQAAHLESAGIIELKRIHVGNAVRAREMHLKEEACETISGLFSTLQSLERRRVGLVAAEKACEIMKDPSQFVRLVANGPSPYTSQSEKTKARRLETALKTATKLKDIDPFAECPKTLAGDLNSIGAFPLRMACMLLHAARPTEWINATKAAEGLKKACDEQIGWPVSLRTISKARQRLYDLGMLERLSLPDSSAPQQLMRPSPAGMERGVILAEVITDWVVSAGTSKCAKQILGFPTNSPLAPRIGLYNLLVKQDVVVEIATALKAAGYSSSAGYREIERLRKLGGLEIQYSSDAKEQPRIVGIRLSDTFRPHVATLIERIMGKGHESTDIPAAAAKAPPTFAERITWLAVLMRP